MLPVLCPLNAKAGVRPLGLHSLGISILQVEIGTLPENCLAYLFASR